VLFQQVLTLNSLYNGKNVLVDGSLRDGEWYSNYLQDLQSKFPNLRIGIVHITAKLETILSRIERRSVGGRYVPTEVVKDSLKTIPKSIKTLSRFMDMYACFANEEDNCDPVCTRLWIKTKAVRSLSQDLKTPAMTPIVPKDKDEVVSDEQTLVHRKVSIDSQHNNFSPRYSWVGRPASDFMLLFEQTNGLAPADFKEGRMSRSESVNGQQVCTIADPRAFTTERGSVISAAGDSLDRVGQAEEIVNARLPPLVLGDVSGIDCAFDANDWREDFAELFVQHCAVDFGIAPSESTLPFASAKN
jgi:hypothetical protein